MHKPKKSLGQNFLIDQNIIRKIINIVNINKHNNVLEIGPGTGNLTKKILEMNPKKVFAIEKDKNLYYELNRKFNSNLTLINQDVLTINWQNLIQSKCIVFGNLPYNISSKILINWIRLNNLNVLFDKFVLMFQKEVADRIISDVNSSKYGRLSILTEWKLKAKKIMDIDPESFYPIPKVKSSLVYFEPKDIFFKFDNPKSLGEVTNIFFQNRRKMIKKPLNILFKDSNKVIKKLNLDEKCRPQNLSPSTYFKISKMYEEEIN